MGLLSNILPQPVKKFLNRNYTTKYSNGKNAECFNYKLADIFDPMDD